MTRVSAVRSTGGALTVSGRAAIQRIFSATSGPKPHLAISCRPMPLRVNNLGVFTAFAKDSPACPPASA